MVSIISFLSQTISFTYHKSSPNANFTSSMNFLELMNGDRAICMYEDIPRISFYSANTLDPCLAWEYMDISRYDILRRMPLRSSLLIKLYGLWGFVYGD